MTENEALAKHLIEVNNHVGASTVKINPENGNVEHYLYTAEEIQEGLECCKPFMNA